MERENSRDGMETLKREHVSRLPYRIRLLEDFLPLYAGPGREYVKMGTISDDQRLEIIEERWGKGQELWGRLKSNAGWISLENVERAII